MKKSDTKRTTYFAIDRKLLEHDLWLDEPFSKGQAWVDIIGKANYADVEKVYKGEKQFVKRGQLLCSERSLAERWHWPKTKVRRFLEELEGAKMIEISRTTNRTTNVTTKRTTITVENYDVYQGSWTTNRTTSVTTKRTYKKKDKKELKNINTADKPQGVFSSVFSLDWHGIVRLTPDQFDELAEKYSDIDALLNTVAKWLVDKPNVKDHYKVVLSFIEKNNWQRKRRSSGKAPSDFTDDDGYTYQLVDGEYQVVR